ncbi:MAG: relaxase/mobilization nuclease domain-containing protein [Alistipes communis]
MTQIAKSTCRRWSITDTQYLLVRHLDQPHPHCHLVYNRVGNNGQTISDKNIKIRNAKVCRELTEKYGFVSRVGKGRRAAGAAARTRQDQIRNLRCNQRQSSQSARTGTSWKVN